LVDILFTTPSLVKQPKLPLLQIFLHPTLHTIFILNPQMFIDLPVIPWGALEGQNSSLAQEEGTNPGG
jgi:hypothetical protein